MHYQYLKLDKKSYIDKQPLSNGII